MIQSMTLKSMVKVLVGVDKCVDCEREGAEEEGEDDGLILVRRICPFRMVVFHFVSVESW